MTKLKEETWTLGMSDTGDKFHLIHYDVESDTYDPVCQLRMRDLQPIAESKVQGRGRVCANCQKTEDMEQILTGIEASRFNVKFTNPSQFKRNHPTS